MRLVFAFARCWQYIISHINSKGLGHKSPSKGLLVYDGPSPQVSHYVVHACINKYPINHFFINYSFQRNNNKKKQSQSNNLIPTYIICILTVKPKALLITRPLLIEPLIIKRVYSTRCNDVPRSVCQLRLIWIATRYDRDEEPELAGHSRNSCKFNTITRN